MDTISILLVDDDPASLLALEAVLEPLCQNLVRASSGEEALRAVLEEDFAVILLDMHMQGLTGLETAALIRQRERSAVTPLIFITAADPAQALAFKAYSAGAVDYLLKPIIPEILQAKVATFIELYRKNALLAEQYDEIKRLLDTLSQHRQAEAMLLERNTWFQTTLTSIGDGFIATDSQGQVIFLNPVAEQLTGWSQGEAVGKAIQDVFTIVNEQTGEPVANPVTRALQEGVIIGLANHTLLIAKDGTRRPIDDSGAPIRDGQGNIIGAALTFRDITERRRAEERQRFLTEAATLLASSLDYQTTLSSVAQLAVPSMADWCAVHTVEPDGTVQQLAVTHVDPAKVAWAYELQQRFPSDPTAKQGVYEVIRTGQSEFIPAITDEMLTAALSNPEQLAIAREIGFSSAMTVALNARGRTLGAIQLVAADSGRHFSAADLAFAEDLAARAASAVDNARLYQEAQQQREHLQVTLGSIGDAVIATDNQGRINFMNPVAEALTGWAQADAAGKPLPDVFHIVSEMTRQLSESPVDKVFREGVVVGLANHTILIARHGREIPIDDSGAPIRDVNGVIIGVILVFRDISERRQSEQERARLFDQEQQARAALQIANQNLQFLTQVSNVLATSLEYEATLQNLAQWVVPHLADNCVIDLVTPDGSLERVAVAATDPAREDVLRELARRFPPDPRASSTRLAVMNKSPRLIPQLTDAYLEAAAQNSEHLALMKATGGTSMMIVPMVIGERSVGAISLGMVDSGRVYTEADLSLMGEVASRAALAIDHARLYRAAQQEISRREQAENDLRHSEQRWRTILQDMPVMVTAFAQDGTYALWNRECELVTGYAADEIVGNPQAVELLYPDPTYRATTVQEWNSRLGDFMNWERDVVRKDGTTRTVAWSSISRQFPIAGWSGWGIGVDVTERRKAEEGLRQAVLARDEFLSVAAHELRTPVTSLRGFAQLLTRQFSETGMVDPERLQKGLARVDEQSVKLTSLINQLLDISRIEAGRLTLERRPIALQPLVQGVVDRFQTMAQHHQITLHSASAAQADIDALRMEQVIANLIDNAIKYSPPGPIEVAITQANDTVQITVTDQGAGIPPEHRAQLFERFYQVRTETTANASGLGLGLYISRQIVELHGGLITAEFPAEGGTRFVIALPV